MSDPEGESPIPETKTPEADPPKTDAEDKPSQGPSLTLMYSLIALALALAIGFAALIVLPFYRRR
jgi:hypothetical protein